MNQSYVSENQRILDIINETIACFHNDAFNRKFVKEVTLKEGKINVPKVFQRYVSYVLFEPKGSAIIKRILYLDGYFIEKLDGVYYVTRDYGERPKAIVRQKDIDKFGLPEEMSEETLQKFVHYMDFDLEHFGI